MSTDIDGLPYYDPIIKNKPDLMSDVWVGSISRLVDTLQTYLSQNGIFLPIMTTEQRDKLLTHQEGQMIYNSTLVAPQIWQSGAWKTFTTV